MNAKRIRKGSAADGSLPMAPMIDVVFLLLVFFVLTLQPADIVAHLDVSRPEHRAGMDDPGLVVTVHEQGFLLNGRAVTFERLDALLVRLGALSSTQPVLVQCARSSRHDALVRTLDVCAKAGLRNVSVATL